MLVVAQLLDWATVDTERGSGGLNNAFDYPATGGIAWALTVAAGVIAFLLASGLVPPGKAPWPTLLLGATVLATSSWCCAWSSVPESSSATTSSAVPGCGLACWRPPSPWRERR